MVHCSWFNPQGKCSSREDLTITNNRAMRQLTLDHLFKYTVLFRQIPHSNYQSKVSNYKKMETV